MLKLKVVTSIQKVESTFSTFRRVEQIDNLVKQKVFAETIFRKNKVLKNEKAEELILQATEKKL